MLDFVYKIELHDFARVLYLSLETSTVIRYNTVHCNTLYYTSDTPHGVEIALVYLNIIYVTHIICL